MQRARRAARLRAACAVLVVLGGLALSGCRSQPGVAYYLGGTRVSESRVDQLAHDAKASVDEFNRRSGGEQAQPEPAPGGDDIVAALVAHDLTGRVADELGARPAPGTGTEQAQGPKSEYTRLRDETLANVEAIAQALHNQSPPAPGDGVVRTAFDRAVAAQVAGANQYDQFKQAILQSPDFVLGSAVRDRVLAAAAGLHVTVNPRYLPAEFPLLTLASNASGRSFVALTLPIGAHG